MIDHVSVGVRDLESAGAFYRAVLAPLEYTSLIEQPETIGFGKKYPDFWINLRPELVPDENNGVHVCLRCASSEAVDEFYRLALEAGGRCDGPPGLRPQYTPNYYAAFVRDPDGNKIEAVTFVDHT